MDKIGCMWNLDQELVRKKKCWDNFSIVTTAHDKGVEEGRAEGLEEGRAEGRAEERLLNAKSLLDNGIPLDIIAKSLSLTEEEIEKIKIS